MTPIRNVSDRERKMQAEISELKKAINISLALLGPLAPTCCGCAFEWGMAIHTLNKAMQDPPA